jgi:Family of unknown function (DUF6308)
MADGFAFDLGKWFSDNAAVVRKSLGKYFSGKPNTRFTGRWFETFAAMGDANRFTPSDVLAVATLSVDVPTESAARLLITEADVHNDLLAKIPQNVDLWEVDRSTIESGSAADQLHASLDDLPKIGWVTSGKLMAAKRPRLIPILDKEVKGLLKPPRGKFWVTMHDQLSDPTRRQTIADVCETAPDGISLLRRIDVALWMYASQKKRRLL